MPSRPIPIVSCPFCGCRRAVRTQTIGGRVLTKKENPDGWLLRRMDLGEGRFLQFSVSYGKAKGIDGKRLGFKTIGGMTLEQMAKDARYAHLIEEMIATSKYVTKGLENALRNRSGKP